MKIKVLEGSYCISKLSKAPNIERLEGFFTLSATKEEISLICSEKCAPIAPLCKNIQKGYAVFYIDDILDFSLKGVLAKISDALKEYSILCVSTYNTDYFMVKQENLESALRLLKSVEY